MIVFDTSIIVDSLLPKLGERYKKACEILERTKDFQIYAPKILKIELTAVLSRKKNTDLAKKFVEELTSELYLIPEEDLFDVAYEIAFLIKGRAVDVYFIATAKITSSILIANDKIMVNNAKKAGIGACYLTEEFEKNYRTIKESKE